MIRVGRGRGPTGEHPSSSRSHQTALAQTLWFRRVAPVTATICRVLTVLVLLRKEANSPSLTGHL